MKKTSFVSILICLLTICLVSQEASGQKQFRLNADAGLSQLLGENSDQWKTGYTLGINGLYAVSERARMGGRIAYAQWSPAESLKSFSSGNGSADGRLSIVELASIVRFYEAPLGSRKNNLFGQIGTGYYVLFSKATATIVSGNRTSTVTTEVTDSRFALNLGAGYALGKLIVSPMFNIVFTDREATTYFSILAGFEF